MVVRLPKRNMPWLPLPCCGSKLTATPCLRPSLCTRQVTVVNRGERRGRELVDLLNGKVRAETGRDLAAELVAWHGDYVVPEGTDILVNATSIGLYPDVDARLAIDPQTLQPGMIVAACDSEPAPHPAGARRRGARLPRDRRARDAGWPGSHRHHLRPGSLRTSR